MKTFKVIDNDISDGYHTFNELYDHRNLLFINLCLELKHKFVTCWRPDYDGWFVLYLDFHGKQISYHIQNKYLPLVENEIHRNDANIWDGHTSAMVLNRLCKAEL